MYILIILGGLIGGLINGFIGLCIGGLIGFVIYAGIWMWKDTHPNSIFWS